MTVVQTNCYQLLIKFTNILMTDLKIYIFFLDISNAFDEVWHQGIIFKLRQNDISSDLLNISSDFLRNKRQRVVLNGQTSTWAIITAGVPQGSNYLPDGLTSIFKLFADDTYLFSVIHDINTSTKELNEDLNKINNWVFQWKMNFKPDPSKQAQEVLFSRTLQKLSHPVVL